MKQYGFIFLVFVLTFLPCVSCHKIKQSYLASFKEIEPMLHKPVLKIGLEPFRLPDDFAVIRGRAESLRVFPRLIYKREHRIYPGILALPERVKYNADCELIVPASINYEIILSDSSRVVVDSESNLYFPLQFGGTREVELRGQALFAIFPDVRPFIVKVGSFEVLLLEGAEFGITAYDKEKPRITVISGRVNIAKGKASITLKEGHQGWFFNGKWQIKPCDSLCDSVSITYKRG